MSSFEHDGFWKKSIVYMRRGIEARNSGDYDDFGFWAAAALELLGKAALSKIHPALVADPQHQESMFTACGHPVGDGRRTIVGKTVYERLMRLSASFDTQARDFCIRMADRRNAELHSAESGFASLKLEAWVSRYWQTVTTILSIQGRTLEEWIGAEEAKGANAIMAKALGVLQQAIESRVESCRVAFDRTAPRGAPLRAFLIAESKRHAEHDAAQSDQSSGATSRPCPACESTAIVAGPFFDLDESRTEIDVDDDERWAIEWVCAIYSAESLECRACGLSLEGHAELEAALVDESFEQMINREPQWGEEYAND